MSLIWFCGAFLLGIAAGDRLGLPAQALMLAALMLAVLAAAVWRQRDLRLPTLLAVAFMLGAVRMAYAQPITTDRSVWRYTGEHVTLVGIVAQQPDRREDKQTAIVRAQRIVIDEGERAVDGSVLLQLAPVPELQYGQQVQVTGTLEQPRSGEDFDYRAYLARHGVYALMSRPKLVVVPGLGGTWWQRTMLRLNDRARTTGLRLISEPHASLLVGIVLGVQSTIPDNVLDAFAATGTSHILVISGWNISVIIAGMIGVLTRLGLSRKRAAGLSLPLIGLYVLFVGATPSVVRAAVMGSLAVIAVLVDREADAWTSLWVACVAMAALDPNVLWDVGFQLSALATAGLFAFARPITAWLSARRPWSWQGLSWAIEPLTATLAASIASLPVLLFYFGRLSLIAPLANVLMLPVVPFAMLFGALATIAGMGWLPLGQVFALLAWPFLEWLLIAAQWLAHIPGAYTTLPAFSIWWVWAYYAAISGVWWYSHRNPAAAILVSNEAGTSHSV